MRIRLISGLPTRLAVAGSVLFALSSPAHAWDQDRVQSQIQPYFGAWLGMYCLSDRTDLYSIAQDNDHSVLGNDFFSYVRPAGGASLGVAYSRYHVGINAGYQLSDGGTSANIGNKLGYSKYEYQVIPVDISLDVALLPNETPINLLIGGSVGLGLVGIRLPYEYLTHLSGTDTVYTRYYNDWNYTNALMGTAYVGARINLARRLNLEGQLGYRYLKSDEVELGRGSVLGKVDQYTVDSSGALKSYTTNFPQTLDLSGVYLRADIRWTFASDAEVEENRSSGRARVLNEILATMPACVRVAQN
jgi:hypothetical protein